MKKLMSINFFLLILILAGCANGESMKGGPEPKMLEVNLSVSPEKAEANEKILFEAEVTYGNEKVEDANEVKFEIWRAHDENHEKIKIEHDKNGVYRLEKSFAKEGTYYIISHVTARDMHNMPKKEFVVGEPSEPEKDADSKEMKDGGSSSDHGH